MSIIDRVAPFSYTHAEALGWLYRILRWRPGPLSVAEVGTWKGGSAIVMAHAIVAAGGGRLLCADTWGEMNGKDGAKAVGDSVRAEFESNVRECLGAFVQTKKGKSPDTVLRWNFRDTSSPLRIYVDSRGSPHAAGFVDDRSLDLVFVDGDHRYDPFRLDVKTWEPKMKPGAIMCGHDYRGEPSVAEAVHERFGSRTVTEMPGDVWAVYV